MPGPEFRRGKPTHLAGVRHDHSAMITGSIHLLAPIEIPVEGRHQFGTYELAQFAFDALLYGNDIYVVPPLISSRYT